MPTLHPDTCDCILDYEIEAGAAAPHKLEFVKACPHHTDHAPYQVLAENQHKNQALAAVEGALPESQFFNGYVWQTPHGPMLVDQNFVARNGLTGSDHLQPVRICNKQMRWEHDANRNLTIHIPTLDDGLMEPLRAKVKTNFPSVTLK